MKVVVFISYFLMVLAIAYGVALFLIFVLPIRGTELTVVVALVGSSIITLGVAWWALHCRRNE